MHPNEELLTRFYTAFQARDAEDMAACLHPQVRFSDPVFPHLEGEEVPAMWAMLCARGEDLRIEFSDIAADDSAGRAHWEARYTFSVTGRRVHNRIDARFSFADGRIAVHDDRFSFGRWARQALGPVGLLLGWSPFVRAKVRATAAKGLTAFRAGH